MNKIFISALLLLSAFYTAAIASDVDLKLDTHNGSSAFNVRDNLSNALMTTKSNGNVGIGTAEPQYALHVYGGSILYQKPGPAVSGYRMADAYGNLLGGLLAYNDNDLALVAEGNGTGEVNIRTSGVDRMRVTSTGNVGIGTTNPGYKLSVVGTIETSGTVGIRFPDGTIQKTASGSNSWNTSGNDIYSSNSGNVGIGSQEPKVKLDVDAGTNYYAGRFRSSNGAAARLIVDSIGSANNSGISLHNNGVNKWEMASVNFGVGGANDFQLYDDTLLQTAMMVDGDSNCVGIGTTSPGYKLSVVGTIETSGIGGVRFPDGTTQITALGNKAGGWIKGGGRITEETITDNVGIGTSAPAYPLTVKTSTASSGITHTDGTISVGTWVGNSGGVDGGWIGTYSNNPLGFFTNNGGIASMLISTSGNVGIGTTNPQYALHVYGGGILYQKSGSAQNGYRIADVSSNILGGLYGMGDSNIAVVASNGGTGEVEVRTNSTERVRVSAAGNVGIGTTNPGAPLDVMGAIGIGAGAFYNQINAVNSQQNLVINSNGGMLYLNGTTNDAVTIASGGGNVGIGTTKADYQLTIKTGTKSYGMAHTDGTRTIGTYVGNISGVNGGWLGTLSNHNLYFFTYGGMPGMMLDTSGNVGIGSTDPTGARLDVITSSGIGVAARNTSSNAGDSALEGHADAGMAVLGVNNSTSQSTAVFQNSGGGPGISVTGNNNYFSGSVGIGKTDPTAKLEIETSGHGLISTSSGGSSVAVWGVNTGGGIGVYGSAGGSGFSGYFPGRLYAGGNVGIGMTGPAHLLQLGADDAYKPNGGSWGNSSDIRLKKNIHPITGALDKIARLQGINYEWINPKEHGNSYGINGGFIAQDVEKIFPSWVKESDPQGQDVSLVSKDGKIKNLSLPFEYDALIVESIKELKKENSDLKKENDELKARNAKFEDRLEKIEDKLAK